LTGLVIIGRFEQTRSVQRPSEYAPTAKDFSAWRTELEDSVRRWDAVIQHFKLKADEAREKLEAVNILLGHPMYRHRSRLGCSNPTVSSFDSETAFTPAHAYWPKIFESLIELGRRARREDVVEKVGEENGG
jgi:hypothetical protein